MEDNLLKPETSMAAPRQSLEETLKGEERNTETSDEAMRETLKALEERMNEVDVSVAEATAQDGSTAPSHAWQASTPPLSRRRGAPL